MSKGDCSRAYNWFCTVNNPTDDDKEYLLNYQCVYILVYEEIAPTTGTLHWHFYLEHKNQLTFSSMKKRFPRARIEQAKGDAQHALDYNDGNIIRKEGVPKCQGKRTDIEKVKELVKTSNMRQVCEQATSYQSIRVAEKLFVYFEKKRNFVPDVFWYYGATGTGKTRRAYEILKDKYGEDDVYFCMDTNDWWQGYDGHQGVILDDIRKDFCKFHTLLRLLDRYPYQVETKGGSRQLLAETMIITCPYHPEDLFTGREDIAQLTRRIKEIVRFPTE